MSGTLRLNSNVWMLGKIPMVENSNNEVIFSHQHQMQMLCLPSNSRITNSQRILWDFLSVFHLVSMLFDLLTVLDIFSHDQIHIRAHTMSQQTHLACEMNDGPFLVMDSQIVLMRQIILWYTVVWRNQIKSSTLERATDENPNFQRVADQPSDENPSVRPQLLLPQSSGSRLTTSTETNRHSSIRERRAPKQSTSRVPPVPSNEAALAFNASSLEPACFVQQTMGKIGAEMSYPVTADMFENPENDWFATASSKSSCSCWSEPQKAICWWACTISSNSRKSNGPMEKTMM